MKRLVIDSIFAKRILDQGHDWALVEEEAKPGDKLALYVLRDGAVNTKQVTGQVIEVEVTEVKVSEMGGFEVAYRFLRIYMEDAK